MARRLSHGWPTIALYGGALALGTAALQWLDYQRMVRSNSDDVVIFVIALAFLALGVFAGVRLLPRTWPRAFDGNPAGREALGISPREYEVLLELAAGRSNKEIARAQGVSPNTVKTHVARLYAKLKATRRTDAVAKARALGIVR